MRGSVQIGSVLTDQERITSRTYGLNPSKMSTGKRLAKRSIIGTRVCALGTDGFYYAGVIQNVKSPHNSGSPSFMRTPLGPPSDPAMVSTSNSANMYVVRFDIKRNAVGPGKVAIHLGVPPNREFRDVELIGPGFRNILECSLKRGQKIFVTNNGRECNGEVLEHDIVRDEVTIKIVAQGHEVSDAKGFIREYDDVEVTFGERRMQ